MTTRGIKFRGLRVEGKGWVYGLPYFIKSEGKCFIINNCQSGTLKDDNTTFTGKEVISESVGQYTGKNDVKDIEIYEGDIIKHGESVRIVEFHAPNYIAIRTNRTNPVLLSFCSSPTIIGNIHEHKQLLK